MEYRLVSASADKSLVTWTFKSKFSKQSKEQQLLEEEEKSEAKEEEEEVVVEDEGESQLDSDVNTTVLGTVKDYHYKPMRFFESFPIKIVFDDSPECCGFACFNSDESDSDSKQDST